MTEDRVERTEVRSQRTDDRRQRTDDRRQRTDDSKSIRKLEYWFNRQVFNGLPFTVHRLPFATWMVSKASTILTTSTT
jgi:hypothetical protein